jgi:hypothetical protein
VELKGEPHDASVCMAQFLQVALVKQAQSEFEAFPNCLEALTSFEHSRMVVDKTEVALFPVDNGVDRTKPNATKASIANQLDTGPTKGRRVKA